MPRSPSPERITGQSSSKLEKKSRPKKEKSGGLRWKEKKPAASAAENGTGDIPQQSNEREFKHRDRQVKRDHSKERGRSEGTWRDRDYHYRRRSLSRSRSPAGRYGDRKPDSRHDRDPSDKESHRREYRKNEMDGYRERTSHRKDDKSKDWTSSRPKADSDYDRRRPDEPPKEKKEKKQKKKSQPEEPMIVVTVNDRLGTKASIPCRASDPIRTFCPYFSILSCFSTLLTLTLDQQGYSKLSSPLKLAAHLTKSWLRDRASDLSMTN